MTKAPPALTLAVLLPKIMMECDSLYEVPAVGFTFFDVFSIVQ